MVEKALIFIADLGIYTRHRVFRLFGSTKYIQGHQFAPRTFVPADENGRVLADFEHVIFEDFAEYFVQRDAKLDTPLLICKEPDGSDAKSTSGLMSYRIDSDIYHDDRLEYYKNGYPFDTIWEWFGDPLREFCFSIETNSGKSIWKRRMFFDSVSRFRDCVLTMVPSVIHIGPIYSSSSNENAVVEKRELVFDIDLNEYVDEMGLPLRKCCGKEKKCCALCWPLALVAKIIISETMRRFTGFSNMRFFFSGGRGIHCWVMDEIAKTMTSEDRSNILKRFAATKTLKMSPEMYAAQKKFKKEELEQICDDLGLDKSKYPKKSDMLKLFWPRFDTAVTTGMTHPIKSPFCIHSVTHKIASEIQTNEFPGK